MQIEQDSTVTQVTYGFRIEDAEPITKNLSTIRMRPMRATVVAINGKIGRIIVTGPALRRDDATPLVGAAHSSVYGEQEVDDAPEVVRRVAEAAREQLGQAAAPIPNATLLPCGHNRQGWANVAGVCLHPDCGWGRPS